MDTATKRLCFALGQFYGALSKDTVLGMSTVEIRAYASLQDAMRDAGVLVTDASGRVRVADSFDPVDSR